MHANHSCQILSHRVVYICVCITYTHLYVCIYIHISYTCSNTHILQQRCTEQVQELSTGVTPNAEQAQAGWSSHSPCKHQVPDVFKGV